MRGGAGVGVAAGSALSGSDRGGGDDRGGAASARPAGVGPTRAATWLSAFAGRSRSGWSGTGAGRRRGDPQLRVPWRVCASSLRLQRLCCRSVPRRGSGRPVGGRSRAASPSMTGGRYWDAVCTALVDGPLTRAEIVERLGRIPALRHLSTGLQGAGADSLYKPLHGRHVRDAVLARVALDTFVQRRRPSQSRERCGERVVRSPCGPSPHSKRAVPFLRRSWADVGQRSPSRWHRT